jgi:hypothetical protein
VITSPSGGTNIIQGQTVTITGTASDVGGSVAGIEVSTDGGATWHPAAGTTNWSYTWTAAGPGTDVIEARATDDSVNLQSSPATVSVNVTGSSTPASLFTASNTPARGAALAPAGAFEAGQQLSGANLAPAGAFEAGQQLSGANLAPAGANTANLALFGQYTAASFATSTDGSGGTLIQDPPATVAQTLTQPQHA